MVVIFKKISLKKIQLWLVEFKYVFSKNYGWSLCIAKNMYKIFGESIVAVAFQSVFYLEMHQNNIFFLFLKNYFWYQRIKMIWKHQKYINLKQRKKIKKINFFQKRFWIAKTNKVLRNSVKKTCKNRFTKTVFKTQFFSGPRSTNITDEEVSHWID